MPYALLAVEFIEHRRISNDPPHLRTFGCREMLEDAKFLKCASKYLKNDNIFLFAVLAADVRCANSSEYDKKVKSSKMQLRTFGSTPSI